MDTARGMETDRETDKVKVKIKVYSLVSSAKRHSPDFTQLPRGHRTCSFIGHLNSPESIQPGCRFDARNYSNTQAFTVLPGNLLTPESQQCMCEESALPSRAVSRGWSWGVQHGKALPSQRGPGACSPGKFWIYTLKEYLLVYSRHSLSYFIGTNSSHFKCNIFGILSTFQLVLHAVAMITKCGRACYVSGSEVACRPHCRVIKYFLQMPYM